MSHTAIAAALALDGVSAGERLAAFSLASFADPDGRARPGTPAAAARAGLARSAYLQARGRLVQRGLVVVEVAATGRGRASTLSLPFANEGPWWEGEINAQLFEAVLGYSPTRGTARLLLAALAALADERGVVADVTTERLCSAAGISDRTYRRVCGPLVASGEAVVEASVGGRGHRNRWQVADPRGGFAAVAASRARRRVAPAAGARPLVATVTPARAPGNPCQQRTVSLKNGPALSGLSVANPGQERTVLPETPAKTPAQTPAPNARAGREPQNPRTTADPPTPLAGGLRSDSILIEETYVTDRGRTRRRQVSVDLAAVRERLAAGNGTDRVAWEQVRALLVRAVGESQFEIWLAPLELIAVDGDTLLLAAPEATESWIRGRFGRLLADAAQSVGRSVRIADAAERRAAETLARVAPPAQLCDGRPPACDGIATVATRVPPDPAGRSQPQLMIGPMAGFCSPPPADRSARAAVCASADTPVHNQLKEVS